jgi:hypothetical protein
MLENAPGGQLKKTCLLYLSPELAVVLAVLLCVAHMSLLEITLVLNEIY